MKLYTEEQVKQMLEVCRDSDLYEHILTFEDILKTETPIELPSDSLCINCDESESTHNICMDCIIKIGKENIQLPSDEEIDAMGKDVIIYNDTKRGWFIEGLKFMRNKIQGGNNEQQ
jgi:ribosomal protein L32